jgi:hypothetical protein
MPKIFFNLGYVIPPEPRILFFLVRKCSSHDVKDMVHYGILKLLYYCQNLPEPWLVCWIVSSARCKYFSIATGAANVLW